VHVLIEIANVLDPRYKLNFMKAFCSFVYREESSITENEFCRVRSLLYELVLKYRGSMEGMATSNGVGTTHRNVVNNERDDLVFDIFNKFLSNLKVYLVP
jgi:hypothetical protein